MNTIRHNHEPSRLLLAWQSSDLSGDRANYAVGEVTCKADGQCVFRYLSDTEGFDRAVKAGFSNYPAFKASRQEHATDVLSVFMRRLPPRDRRDFPYFLEALRLPRNAEISDFALLGYSGARSPSDGFWFVMPFDDHPERCEFLSEVAGHRYYQGSRELLRPGRLLDLEPEPNNDYDPNAVRLSVDGDTVGYVNRLQAPAFQWWLEHAHVTARVDRLNGSGDRTRLFVFFEISPLKDLKQQVA